MLPRCGVRLVPSPFAGSTLELMEPLSGSMLSPTNDPARLLLGSRRRGSPPARSARLVKHDYEPALKSPLFSVPLRLV